MFQAHLIKRIHKEIPDAVVLKTDPNYIQGFPDLLILRGKTWASLEVKRDEHAARRPNQDYYIQKLNEMSYARFVYPENEEEIMHEVHTLFGTGRAARLSEPESAPMAEVQR